ncbi:hypothetical protein PCANC_26706 [Puccinia coronata f. sp. avenae]|uniref:Uncharacterized protein n=1 Tax=Puccinia coronata f. sp. avenae TaxID=200324 RepID=A0A2N5TCT8_9BASI|nr:hypothetical protein PCANC_26706 [Puccinia coronata f. sp. avenae]
MSSKRVTGQQISEVPGASPAALDSSIAAPSANAGISSDTITPASLASAAPLASGDAANRAPAKKARITKSKAKDTAKRSSSQDIRQPAKSDGLHDVQSSDSEDAIFKIAKEPPVDVLNPTLNSKELLTNEERLVLWKMARDADIRGDTMTSSTFMSFLNKSKVSQVIPAGTKIPETPNPRVEIAMARSEFPGVMQPSSTNAACTAPLAIPVEMTSSGDKGETVYEKGLAFASGAISNSTIWQEDAQCIHIQKRNQLDDSTKDRLTYIGHPFDSEWTQTYKVWEANHRAMYNILLNVYNLQRFASDMRIHKKTCDELCSHHGFLPAFRYDILMRTNTFNHCVLHNGIEHVPNISKFRRDIWQICHVTLMNADELSFQDNPYVDGGVRFGWDTTTGTPKKPKAKQNNDGPEGNTQNNIANFQGGSSNAPGQSSSTGGLQANSNSGNGGGGFRGNRGGFNKNRPQNSQKRSFDKRNE